jgi:hypothetical protein
MARSSKQQRIDTLVAENENLRSLLAASYANLDTLRTQHEENVRILNRKLFQLSSDRSKWEARARAAQSTSVSAARSSYAERMLAAREEAMRTGRSVAVGSV